MTELSKHCLPILVRHNISCSEQVEELSRQRWIVRVAEFSEPETELLTGTTTVSEKRRQKKDNSGLDPEVIHQYPPLRKAYLSSSNILDEG